MPFKSQAQRRKFYAMASRGEISPSTVKEWEDATPKGKKLPEKVKKAYDFSRLKQLGQSHVLRHVAVGTGAGALGGGLFGFATPLPDDRNKPATLQDRLRTAKMWGATGALLGGLTGLHTGALKSFRNPAGRLRNIAEEMARVDARMDATRKALIRDLEPLMMKQADAFLDELTKIADLASIVLSQIARQRVAPPVTKGISDVEEAIAEKWRRFSTPEDLGYRPPPQY
jgi:hypothetical protein